MKYLIYAAVFALIAWSVWYLTRRVSRAASGECCTGANSGSCTTCEGCAYAGSCDKIESIKTDGQTPEPSTPESGDGPDAPGGLST